MPARLVDGKIGISTLSCQGQAWAMQMISFIGMDLFEKEKTGRWDA
jgi:hypothetical protein